MVVEEKTGGHQSLDTLSWTRYCSSLSRGVNFDLVLALEEKSEDNKATYDYRTLSLWLFSWKSI